MVPDSGSIGAAGLGAIGDLHECCLRISRFFETLTERSMPLDIETRFFCLADFEPAARELLPHAVYEYLAAGGGEEITKRDNEAAFDRIRLRPRVLRD
jgi:FMN-dependent dehydrogenase